jgi:hypothetical protein
MPAFQFPDPAVEQSVINPSTGSTYIWKASPGKWIVQSNRNSDQSDSITQLQTDVADNTSDINDLKARPLPKDYMIGTDKNLTRIGTARSGPALELVDSEGYFSNVKFAGLGGLVVTSNESTIFYDATNVSGGNSDVDLDNYYTKIEADATETHLQAQIDELLITKGTASVYTLNDIGIQLGARPGDFFIDNTVAKLVTVLTLSPEDDNGNTRPIGEVGDILEIVSATNSIYRYTISQITEGLATVEFISAADPNDLLIPGQTFNIYVYPQNKTSASIDYVDQQDELKLSKTGGNLTGTLNSKTGTSNIPAYKIVNANNNNVSLQLWSPGGSGTEIKYVGKNNTDHWFQVYDETDDNPVTPARFGYQSYNLQAEAGVGYGGSDKHYFTGHAIFFDRITYDGPTVNATDVASKQYVDEAIGLGGAIVEDYLPKSGGVMTGELHFDRGDGGGNMMIYPNVGTADTAIYALNSSAMRFRTVNGDRPDSGDRRTHIGISKDPVTAEPITNIYHLVDPTSSTHAANKRYVDNAVAGIASSLSIEDDEPDIHYGDYPPTGERKNGEVWFDSMNLRLNVYSQGQWVNPDRNDGADVEDRMSALEVRLAQLEAN